MMITSLGLRCEWERMGRSLMHSFSHAGICSMGENPPATVSDTPEWRWGCCRGWWRRWWCWGIEVSKKSFWIGKNLDSPTLNSSIADRIPLHPVMYVWLYTYEKWWMINSQVLIELKWTFYLVAVVISPPKY